MESPVCRPGIADRLAALIRVATVSEQREARAEAFAAFPRVLAEAYPLLHSLLERVPVEGSGLMFRWRGRSASAPLVLMAHWDVVPAPDADAWQSTGWTVDPFAGARTVRDGRDAVVGRGADLAEARARAYAGVEAIDFEGAQWRTDIALKAERGEIQVPAVGTVGEEQA